jgi:imidazolonepropionase-like amidohydrolase
MRLTRPSQTRLSVPRRSRPASLSHVSSRIPSGCSARAWARAWALPCYVALAVASALSPMPASAQLRAFTGATLVDGTDRAAIPNAVLLLRDGRVVAAGPAVAVSIPAGAERVALNGTFIVPGFINAHGHVNAARDLSTYAAYGVTTVYSLGGEPADVFAARASQDTPQLARARVYLSGAVVTAGTEPEARAQVNALADQRVDVVKIRVDDNLGTVAKMPPAVYGAVIDQAHRRGLRVAAHLFYHADAEALLDAGADFVAHSVRDREMGASLLRTLKAKGICVSPTLMREVSTFVYESTPSWFDDPLFTAHANPEWVANGRDPQRQAAVRASSSAQRYKAALAIASRNVRRMAEADVTIAMGTDTGPAGRFQGYFELMELELMVKAGLTPRRALQSAWGDAARCIGRQADLGTLERGKWGDFVVLEADPLADIANVRRIHSVWIAGNQVTR